MGKKCGENIFKIITSVPVVCIDSITQIQIKQKNEWSNTYLVRAAAFAYRRLKSWSQFYETVSADKT
jgi:hypothetical protein